MIRRIGRNLAAILYPGTDYDQSPDESPITSHESRETPSRVTSNESPIGDTAMVTRKPVTSAVTSEAPTSEDRLELRFDPKQLAFWPADAKRRTRTNRVKATILEYVERPSSTPSGGKFTSQRFTVSINGRKWVGQTKNGTDIVRLRPDPR